MNKRKVKINAAEIEIDISDVNINFAGTGRLAVFFSGKDEHGKVHYAAFHIRTRGWDGEYAKLFENIDWDNPAEFDGKLIKK